MKNLVMPDVMLKRQTFGFLDDFDWYVTAHRWTSILTDTGTAAVGDAHAGIITLLPSDGTVADEDEAYIKTTNELFLFAVDKPLLFEARIQYAEAATNAANVIAGFASAVAANHLQDAGAGPPASYSGAVIFKVDGSTVWQFETSIAGAQITTVSNVTAGGAGSHVLRIEVREAGGIMEAVPLIDTGSGMIHLTDTNNRPIKHTFAPTSATEMNAFIGVKNGTAAQQALTCDYIGAFGAR
jgi:hypothetical protein